MRSVWKWIIGIVVGLVVLGLIAGGVWFVSTRVGYMTRIVQVTPRNFQSPNTPNGQNPYGNGPYVMPYGHRGFPMMPMMGYRGFGLGPIAGIIGFLFFAGFIVLLVLGIVWLVRRSNRSVAAVAAASVAPPASPAMATHACANCGQPVQDGWEFCPNCGTKQ